MFPNKDLQRDRNSVPSYHRPNLICPLFVQCIAGYTNILQQLANSCTSLRQVNLNPTVPLSSAATQQLVPHIQLLSTLVKDTWAVLKALNGLGAYVEGAGAAVADAAGSTADIGSSLLAGLMAASRAAGDVDDTMKGEHAGLFL